MDPNLVISLPADALGPNGARASACAVLITKSDIFSTRFLVIPITFHWPDTVFHNGQYHSGWTPFYFMYDPKCSTTFPWCTINAPAAFAWCTINVPAAFARCTNRFVHKVEFSYIGWNGVHPLWIWSLEILQHLTHWPRGDLDENLDK